MNSFTKLKLIITALLLFVISGQALFAQSDIASDKESYKELIKLGIKKNEEGKFAAALEYWTKAEVLAAKHNWKDELVFVSNNLGITYNNLSNYGEALGYYQKSLAIAEEYGLKNRIPVALINIGILYSNEKDYKSAISYYKRAYPLTSGTYDSDTHVILAANLSDVYNDMNNFKEARKYLDDVKNLPKSKTVEQLWKINYAETLILEGNLSEAQKITGELLKVADNKNEVNCYQCIVDIVAKLYTKQNKIDLALVYLKKGLQNTTEMNERVELYGQLANLYIKSKNYTVALKYKDSAFYAKDSLSLLINRGLFESNKVKLKVQEYQNELQASQEKQSAERTLFITGTVFSILLFFFIYKSLKNKQKQERIITENRQKIVELEMDNLKNSISEKNRKLSTKALYLSGRNELIEEVINSLSQVPEVADNSEVSKYMTTLKSYLRTDAEWEDFTTYFEQANPNFLKALTTKHPQLTSGDIRFICYVLMNLDIREISTIFNITINAATKRKRRIKEKMEIDKDDSLYEYLLKLT
jgi:tetratricopeptide (TPR) repeat protein